MATYTLTIDLTGFVYPINSSEILFENCQNILSLSEGSGNINDFAVAVCKDIELIIGGDTICVFVIIDSKITFTLTTSENFPCNDLIAIRISSDEGQWYNQKWIPTITACPTCQEVVIDNCGTVIFEAAVPNGTYEVQVEDHQSGVTYMQDIEFTGSQGTWDQTNTSGVFSPFSVYTVTILDAEGDPVSWVDGANEYNCMRLTFNQSQSTDA